MNSIDGKRSTGRLILNWGLMALVGLTVLFLAQALFIKPYLIASNVKGVDAVWSSDKVAMEVVSRDRGLLSTKLVISINQVRNAADNIYASPPAFIVNATIPHLPAADITGQITIRPGSEPAKGVASLRVDGDVVYIDAEQLMVPIWIDGQMHKFNAQSVQLSAKIGVAGKLFSNGNLSLSTLTISDGLHVATMKHLDGAGDLAMTPGGMFVGKNYFTASELTYGVDAHAVSVDAVEPIFSLTDLVFRNLGSYTADTKMVSVGNKFSATLADDYPLAISFDMEANNLYEPALVLLQSDEARADPVIRTTAVNTLLAKGPSFSLSPAQMIGEDGGLFVFLDFNLEASKLGQSTDALILGSEVKATIKVDQPLVAAYLTNLESDALNMEMIDTLVTAGYIQTADDRFYVESEFKGGQFYINGRQSGEVLAALLQLFANQFSADY